MTAEDVEYLEWLHARMLNVYGEGENRSYMHGLRRVIQHAKEAVGAVPDPQADQAADSKLSEIQKLEKEYRAAERLVAASLSKMRSEKSTLDITRHCIKRAQFTALEAYSAGVIAEKLLLESRKPAQEQT